MAKTGSRVVAVTFIAIIAIGVLLAIAQDQETLQIRSAVAADDPKAVPYVAALIDAGVSRGNSFDVLTNGDQFLPAMLDAINAAQQRIAFETYIYKTGKVADQFTAALEAATRRGVGVNLVVDSLGSSGMSHNDVKRLERAGCRIADFHSPKWYDLEDINYRTHRKILVVDGQLGFVGRRRHRESLGRQRARQAALARHAGADARADCAAARGCVL